MDFQKIIESMSLAQKEVLTIDELVIYTGKSKSTIYKLTSSRNIPCYKNGKNVYFKRQEIDEWLTSRRVSTQEDLNQAALDHITHNL